MMLVTADPVEAAFLGIGHGVDIGLVKLGPAFRIETVIGHWPIRPRTFEPAPRHEMKITELHEIVLYEAIRSKMRVVRFSPMRQPSAVRTSLLVERPTMYGPVSGTGVAPLRAPSWR